MLPPTTDYSHTQQTFLTVGENMKTTHCLLALST